MKETSCEYPPNPLNPKISIITVVYNAGNLLESTIQSVINQTYLNIEYIIVDGGSTDGTLDIIRKYENKITRWITEKDQGLYDAMNKGIKLATGDFVWFMNAGDLIPCDKTLACALRNYKGEDVLYGETVMLNESFESQGLRSYKKLPDRLTWHSMKKGMVVCHQSMLVRRELAPEFDLNHPYSGDIDWTIRLLKKTDKTLNTHTILSKFLAGGVSSKKRKASLIDRFKILKKHFGLFATILVHIEFLVNAILRGRIGA